MHYFHCLRKKTACHLKFEIREFFFEGTCKGVPGRGAGGGTSPVIRLLI